MDGEARGLIFDLVKEVHLTLQVADDAMAGIAKARAALAGLTLSAERIAVPIPRALPALAELPQALNAARSQGFGRIAGAIEAAAPHLAWVPYDRYPAEMIGERFVSAHAFAELIGGPDTPLAAPDIAMGIFLIGARTFYRDHRHPAPELYFSLTGPTAFRFGAGGEWSERRAGEAVWNESNTVHATRVHDVPWLCIYVWTRNVAEPAVVVEADDWAEIERGL